MDKSKNNVEDHVRWPVTDQSPNFTTHMEWYKSQRVYTGMYKKHKSQKTSVTAKEGGAPTAQTVQGLTAAAVGPRAAVHRTAAAAGNLATFCHLSF